MYKYLKSHGVNNVKHLINTGKKHGITSRDTTEYDDIDILIVVDSLDENYDIYSQIKEKGIEIVILDHHKFVDYPDDAILISSAKNYLNKNLSGSGVVWKFCYYLDCLSSTQYSKNLLDLAACGILADVCDMSENSPENRYLVNCGLNNLQNAGLKAILGNYSFSSQSVLWSIAPLVNAANRTGNNQLAVDLFLCDDKKQLKKIVTQLKDIKAEQDEIVKNSFGIVEMQIKQNNIDADKVIYGFVPEYEYAGLIATKVANKYNKPCIIFHNPNEDNENLKGSIRGFGVEDFGKDINSTQLAQCFGHENAAGIVCKKSNLNNLISAINAKYQKVVFTLQTDVDLLLKFSDISEELIQELEKINMLSGKNFKPITICMTDVEIYNPTQMQNKHTKFNYYDLSFIKWNDIELYHKISEKTLGHSMIVDVIGELQISYFAGKKQLQLIISDYNNLTLVPDFLVNN
jgi:single-stranded-DNA-specific exonuclease